MIDESDRSKDLGWPSRLEDATFLLGAGFSRAISDHMPLMVDLRDLIVGELPATSPLASELDGYLSMFDGDVEAVLAYLGEPPIFLDEATRLELQAKFVQVRRALTTGLQKAESLNLGIEPIGWLRHLVHWWHAHRSTVITLNYDTLIERAASAVLVWNVGGRDYSLAAENLYCAPTSVLASRFGTAVLGWTEHETFQLVKLHGSVSWHWPQVRQVSEPIFSEPIPAWESDTVYPLTEEKRSQLLAGLEPAVIPPVAAKSAFLNNLTIQAQWKSAASARKRHLVVIGYSLPPGDGSVRQLLAQEFQDSHLIIVDLDKDVIARFEIACPDRSGSRVIERSFIGRSDALPRLVDWLEEHAPVPPFEPNS